MKLFQAGSGRWGVDYADPSTGRRVRRVVGTREEAEHALEAIGHERFRRRWLPSLPAPQSPPPSITLAELADRHIASAERASNARYREFWDRMLGVLGISTPISEVTFEHLVDLRLALAARPGRKGQAASRATVNRHLACVRAALRLAVEQGWLARDPWRRGLRLPESNARDRVATPEEIAALLSRARPALRLAIRLAYDSGMRLSEILRLEWADVDLARSLAKVQRSKTDRGRQHGRTVPLLPTSVAALRAWRAEHPDSVAVFEKRASFPVKFHRLARMCGIEGLTFHDLRHTAATRFRRAGVDVFTLKRIMGWRSWEMAERYQTIDEHDLTEVLSKVR